MTYDRILPDNPLEFIRQCVINKRILWTYHVTMRMEKRSITRDLVIGSAHTFEVIESYPEDKYLPSYLIHANHEGEIFHVLFAADVANQNVRVITAYYPNPDQWTYDYRRRRLQ
jgi:hypothetical protein